jgi:phage anti-repressor protein
MTDINFSIETAQSLFDSDEQYPVDFDFAWLWLGYTRKDTALDMLKNNFEENIDFIQTRIFRQMEVNSTQQGSRGRVPDSYWLSVDCLKSMGMMAKTEKGKEVRKYFLQCEKLAKEFMKTHKNLTIASAMSNRMVEDYNQLKELSSFYANEFINTIGISTTLPAIAPQNTQENMDVSAILNRAGLTLNKSMKAFEMLGKASSPQAFIDLKRAYQELADEFSRLMTIKNPNTDIASELMNQIESLEKEHNNFVKDFENRLKTAKDEANTLVVELNDIITKQYKDIDNLKEQLKRAKRVNHNVRSVPGIFKI